jgi:hypothetical protein
MSAKANSAVGCELAGINRRTGCAIVLAIRGGEVEILPQAASAEISDLRSEIPEATSWQAPMGDGDFRTGCAEIAVIGGVNTLRRRTSSLVIRHWSVVSGSWSAVNMGDGFSATGWGAG